MTFEDTNGINEDLDGIKSKGEGLKDAFKDFIEGLKDAGLETDKINNGLSQAEYLKREIAKTQRQSNIGLNSQKNLEKQIKDQVANVVKIKKDIMSDESMSLKDRQALLEGITAEHENAFKIALPAGVVILFFFMSDSVNIFPTPAFIKVKVDPYFNDR